MKKSKCLALLLLVALFTGIKAQEFIPDSTLSYRDLFKELNKRGTDYKSNETGSVLRKYSGCKLRSKEDLNGFVELFKEVSDVKIKNQVSRIMRSYRPSNKQDEQPLINFLNHQDREVRLAAIAGVTQNKVTDALPILREKAKQFSSLKRNMLNLEMIFMDDNQEAYNSLSDNGLAAAGALCALRDTTSIQMIVDKYYNSGMFGSIGLPFMGKPGVITLLDLARKELMASSNQNRRSDDNMGAVMALKMMEEEQFIEVKQLLRDTYWNPNESDELKGVVYSILTEIHHDAEFTMESERVDYRKKYGEEMPYYSSKIERLLIYLNKEYFEKIDKGESFDSYQVSGIIRDIGLCEGAEVAIPLLEKYLTNDNKNIRDAAFIVIIRIGEKESLIRLRDNMLAKKIMTADSDQEQKYYLSIINSRIKSGGKGFFTEEEKEEARNAK